jgi:hypothetical protein
MRSAPWPAALGTSHSPGTGPGHGGASVAQPTAAVRAAGRSPLRGPGPGGPAAGARGPAVEVIFDFQGELGAQDPGDRRRGPRRGPGRADQRRPAAGPRTLALAKPTGRGLRRQSAAHPPFPPWGTEGGKAPHRGDGGGLTTNLGAKRPPFQPAARMAATQHERGKMPPSFFLPSGDSPSPPKDIWGRRRVGAGPDAPTNPGPGWARPVRATPQPPCRGPGRAGAPSPAMAGRGTGAAGAGPRRGTQGQPRWLAGRWTTPRAGQNHELESDGLSRMRFPRPKHRRKDEG